MSGSRAVSDMVMHPHSDSIMQMPPVYQDAFRKHGTCIDKVCQDALKRYMAVVSKRIFGQERKVYIR